jgi:hypothetical protein
MLPSHNTPDMIRPLLNREQDMLLLEGFLNTGEATEILNEMTAWNQAHTAHRLTLPDGEFFPLPYSTVRADKEDLPALEANDQYLRSAEDFRTNVSDPQGSPTGRLLQDMETSLGICPLTVGGRPLLPLGVRTLRPGSAGIDIHCENAFLNQLSDDFKEMLYSAVDLENALSVFITLSAADHGGDLIVFDHEWDAVLIELNRTSYEERHDANGSIFTSRNHHAPSGKTVRSQSGTAVIFRAAQIWHMVSPVLGKQDRVTVGCFIGQGHDGKVYYWA